MLNVWFPAVCCFSFLVTSCARFRSSIGCVFIGPPPELVMTVSKLFVQADTHRLHRDLMVVISLWEFIGHCGNSLTTMNIVMTMG